MKRKSLKGLTQREYAEHRKRLGLPGGTSASVNHALKARRISALVDGSIDPDRADAEWAGRTDPTKSHAKEAEPIESGADDADVETTFRRARAAQAYWDARNKRLKYRKDEGELVEVSGVVEQVGKMISAFRSQLLLMPDKVAPRIAAVADVRECRQIIAREVNAALSGLAGYRAPT